MTSSANIGLCPLLSLVNSGFYSHLVLSTRDCVNKRLFLFEIMSTWTFCLLGMSCHMTFCSLWQSIMTVSPHSSSSANSFESGLVHLLFCLL